MRAARLRLSDPVVLLACSVVGVTALASRPAEAQPIGLDPNRDCQNLVTCRFSKGGSYRGCLSSYSCRVCRLVPAPCSIGPGSRVCYRMVCTWG
jgi:hypothetical protein